MESEELKALNFVRRALLRKNDKLREFSRKISRLEGEVGRLKHFEWKCADQEKEIQSLRAELGVDHFTASEKEVENQTNYEERFDTSNERLQEGIGDPDQPGGDEVKFIKSEVGIPLDADPDANNSFLDTSPRPRKRRRPGSSAPGSGSAADLEAAADGDDLTDSVDVAASFDSVDPAAGAGEGEAACALSNDSDALQQQQQHYLASMALAAEQTSVLDHALDEDGGGGGGGSRRRGQPGGAQANSSSMYTYRCKICGKNNRDAYVLKCHMRAHTGERPFTCPARDCHFRATTAGNIKQHVVSRHKDFPLIECHICRKTFYDADLLHAHTVRFHNYTAVLGAAEALILDEGLPPGSGIVRLGPPRSPPDGVGAGAPLVGGTPRDGACSAVLQHV